jgi:hypothetical protein
MSIERTIGLAVGKELSRDHVIIITFQKYLLNICLLCFRLWVRITIGQILALENLLGR